MIVAVGGGFDPIHVGHLELFKAARGLAPGARLVVILNSDDWLKRKKGYVFMSFEERRQILQELRSVDYVVGCVDAGDTVAETLRMIKPRIFANGGDRTLRTLPPEEIAVCKKLKIKVVCGVGGDKIQSSSRLVQKIEAFSDKRSPRF